MFCFNNNKSGFCVDLSFDTKKRIEIIDKFGKHVKNNN